MKIKKIDSFYSLDCKNKIRDKESSTESLKENLKNLGTEIGKEICKEFPVITKEIITPIEKSTSTKIYSNQYSVIISTKDDYAYLNEGIRNSLPGEKLRGYMDFSGIRGTEALTAPIRDIKLPETKHKVDNLIIAKTVLATSCTAISLAEKAYKKYKPKNLIFASIFYSDFGVQELQDNFPNAKIILIDESDDLDINSGMLIPGLGNIDDRLKEAI